MNGEAGKGDKPRPKSISESEYLKRYEKAFGKTKLWFETQEHKNWVKEAEQEKKRAVRHEKK